MTEEKTQRRKNYFINKQVQGIYALIIIVSVSIISLLVGMEILRSFYGTFGIEGEGGFLSNLDVWFVVKVVSLLVIGSLCIGGLSLFTSHRIAGPIFRLNTSLKRVARGNLSERVAFRKNDFFHDVAANFNSMVESFEKKVTEETKIVDEMNKQVDDIVSRMNLAQLDRNATIESLEQLKQMIAGLQQKLIEERGY
ncbi:HAMP domain-containing protein [bacterium]|nr:HAMP domain-containing protein [bacterium]MCP5462091.1 HAMP domain-containing protein [bacterium]